ncbi:hypothetical protein T12_3751 [Trichinella patagoniensis]|uniref:Uncharacterized protein n=1 Tax=Trichinella patagoniensis TaxID=990121 RepID=A0A0V0YUI8_9BILA|nr:hypothetical protein T12_3751 [Trichinella patagoniensis]
MLKLQLKSKKKMFSRCRSDSNDEKAQLAFVFWR